MRIHVLAAVIALSLIGCEAKKPAPAVAPAPAMPTKTASRVPLVDLTSASSLAAVRTAFNTHAGEARFLTLLSPT